jgi:hypothetical protein
MTPTRYDIALLVLSAVLAWLYLRERHRRRRHTPRSLHRKAGAVVIAARELVHLRHGRPEGQTGLELAQWGQVEHDLLEKLGEAIDDFDHSK